MRYALAIALIGTWALTAPAQQIIDYGGDVGDIVITLQEEGSREEKKVRLDDRMRGSISVLYFFSARSRTSLDYLTDVAILKARFGNAVKLMGFVPEKREDFSKRLEGRDVSATASFSTVFYNASGANIYFGAFGIPYVVIFDPEVRLIWRGAPTDDLEQRIERYIERYDPPMADDSWLAKRYAKAEKAFQQGEYGNAYWRAMRIEKITGDESSLASINAKAEELMQRAETKAQDWLNEAVRLEREGKYEEAARIVANIAVRFHDPAEEDEDRDRGGRRDENLSIQRKAEVEIGRMNSRRELKQEIRDARKNEEGWVLLDIAEQAEEDGRLISALWRYAAVSRQFEKVEAGEEADRRWERISEDDALQARVKKQFDEEQAYRWYDIAEALADKGLDEMARDYYDRLMKEYPDTIAAKHAKAFLSKEIEAAASAARN